MSEGTSAPAEPGAEDPATDEPAPAAPVISAGDDSVELTLSESGITAEVAGENRPAQDVILGASSSTFDVELSAAAGTTDQPYAVEIIGVTAQSAQSEEEPDPAETPEPSVTDLPSIDATAWATPNPPADDQDKPADQPAAQGSLRITADQADTAEDPAAPADERLAFYSPISPDSAAAFDLDHGLESRWELNHIPGLEAWSQSDPVVYCATIKATAVSEAPGALPELTSATTTLRIVTGSGWEDLDPAHLPACATADATAQDGSAPGSKDSAEDGTTADAMTVVTSLEATQVDFDSDNPAAPAEDYYSAEAAAPLDPLGFAYTGDSDYQQVAFRLIAGPEGGHAQYRNSTADGILADNPATVRTILPGQTTAPVHRALNTRDLFGQWEFSADGVYCVGYGFRGLNTQDTQVDAEVIDYAGILKFAVGDADPASVSCGVEASLSDSMLEFPAYPIDASGWDPAPQPQPTGSAEPDPTSGPTEPAPAPTATSSATADGQDAEGADESQPSTPTPDPAATPTPTPNSTADPNIRTMRGPAAATFCPANTDAAQQVRTGTYVMSFGDDIAVTRQDGKRTIKSGSTVVINQASTRDAVAGIPDFAATQSHYWATGSSNGKAAAFVWNTENREDDLELSLTQHSGPGKALIFGAETSGPGIADGSPGTLPAGSTGNLIFGFNSPGEYELTLSVGEADYTLNFAVGDQNPTAVSVVTSTILASCADASVDAQLLDPAAQAPEPDSALTDPNAAADAAAAANTLGEEWWAIAIAGLVLAGILVAFIVGTVMNSRKGY